LHLAQRHSRRAGTQEQGSSRAAGRRSSDQCGPPQSRDEGALTAHAMTESRRALLWCTLTHSPRAVPSPHPASQVRQHAVGCWRRHATEACATAAVGRRRGRRCGGARAAVSMWRRRGWRRQEAVAPVAAHLLRQWQRRASHSIRRGARSLRRLWRLLFHWHRRRASGSRGRHQQPWHTADSSSRGDGRVCDSGGSAPSAGAWQRLSICLAVRGMEVEMPARQHRSAQQFPSIYFVVCGAGVSCLRAALPLSGDIF
jgi:hypothetical protein